MTFNFVAFLAKNE